MISDLFSPIVLFALVGSVLGNSYNITGVRIKCNVTAQNLKGCQVNKMWGCISRKYVSLFCSNRSIEEGTQTSTSFYYIV